MDGDNCFSLIRKETCDDLACENKNSVGRVTALSSAVKHRDLSLKAFFGNKHVAVK